MHVSSPPLTSHIRSAPQVAGAKRMNLATRRQRGNREYLGEANVRTIARGIAVMHRHLFMAHKSPRATYFTAWGRKKKRGPRTKCNLARGGTRTPNLEVDSYKSHTL